MSAETSAVSVRANNSVLHRILVRAEGPALIFLIVLFVVFSLTVDGFLSYNNLQGVLAQVSVVGIVALALNQVIISGEIDISTGSLLAVCTFALGLVAAITGGVLLPLMAALAVGAAIGTINGVLSTWGRMPSIIVTLGMLSVLRGGLLFFGASTVLDIPSSSRVLGQGAVGGVVPVSILMLLLVYAFFQTLNRHSIWGRDVMAIGGNENAARYAGLRIEWTRFIAFVGVGLCTGLAAMIFLGQIGQVQATAATGFELQAIAAVVVGGTSILGGKGSTLAPLIGAVLIGMILNTMVLLSIPGTLVDLVTGALILLAISTDAIRRQVLKGS